MSTKPNLSTKSSTRYQNFVNCQYQTLGFGKLVRIDRLVNQCYGSSPKLRAEAVGRNQNGPSLERETVEWQIATNESNSAGCPDFHAIPSMLSGLFELR